MKLALGAVVAAVGAFVLFFLVADGDGAGESAEWEQVASMPQRRSYVAAAQIDEAIYTAGGMVGDTGRPLATFTRYDAVADRWDTLPQLPQPTRAAAAAASGDTLYVFGGTTPDGNTGDVWAWDGEHWSARAPLPSPRFNHSAIAVGDDIYVLGGFRSGRELRDVLVYDTRADSWRRSTALPEPNHAFDVVLFRGEIWMLGGRRGEEVLREVRILDPRTGRWRDGPTMPEPMELLGAAVSGDEIHAVWESTYQIYDAGDGGVAGRPDPRRHPPRALGLRRRRRALRGRRLHDGPAGQPDRGAARALVPADTRVRGRGASRSPSAGPRSCPRRSRGSSGRGRAVRSRTRP